MFTPMLTSAVWVSKVLAAFLRFQPATTLTVIFALALAQLSQVITFFLPIKIIILAGSEGVPRYLRPIIDDDQRDLAIIILLVATIALVAFIYVLRWLAQTLSDVGGIRALERANQMALPSRERTAAPRYFAQFCELAANIAFVGGATTLLIWLSPLLSATLLTLITLELLMTGIVIGGADGGSERSARRLIRAHLSGYLEVLVNVNLVGGFLVLLIPLLTAGSQQFLVVLLSFLLLKRILASSKKAINQMVKLTAQRSTIDPIVFRRCKVGSTREQADHREFAEAFDLPAREALASALLEETACEGVQAVHWRDSSAAGVYHFVIACDDRSGQRRQLQQLVFPQRTAGLLEHEELLFTHLAREHLQAPTVVARAEHLGFAIQVCDAGTGVAPEKALWSEQWPALVARLWLVEPPRALMKAYLSARSALPARLSDQLLAEAQVAVDGSEEHELLQQLRHRLPAVVEQIARLPLVIHNPRLTRDNCMVSESGTLRIMCWWSWAIEPMGYGLPPDTLADVVEVLHRCEPPRRKRGFRVPMLADLQLVVRCQRLESALYRQAYKSAFLLGEEIMTSHRLAKRK